MQALRNGRTSIFIAANDASRAYPSGDGYIVLQTGRAAATTVFGAIGDDQGESISLLNNSFCELTALYWLWKNDGSHIVGLSHQRRYFAPLRSALEFAGTQIAAADDFSELQAGADIVVPMARHWEQPVIQQYSGAHIGHDMFLAREEVESRTPEYLDAFDFVMRIHTLSHHNMFVGRKVVLDEYCSWLFPILFALEKIIAYEFYDSYQERVFGYLAERLFNVWLAKNRRRYRVAYRSIVLTEAGIFA